MTPLRHDPASTHAERMADPSYAAHVHAVVAKAPPLSEEQRHVLGGIFHGSVPARQARRTA